jgi:hypothetical protein
MAQVVRPKPIRSTAGVPRYDVGDDGIDRRPRQIRQLTSIAPDSLNIHNASPDPRGIAARLG